MAHSPTGERLYPTFTLHLSAAHTMEAVPHSIRSEALSTYNAAHKPVTDGLYSSISHKENTAWKKWDSFCTWICIPIETQGIHNPIPFLQIFDHKVCTGLLTTKCKPKLKLRMEQYILYVG